MSDQNAKRQRAPASPPRKTTAEEDALIDRIRKAWTAIDNQQHHVSAARQKLSEELRKLREVSKALLDLSRPMPLLDGATR